MKKIIFCDAVVDNKQVEPDYENEWKAAQGAGFEVSLISFEELVEGNIRKALRYTPSSEQKMLGIYRGWMLRPHQYEALYKGLLEKNIQLVNNPSAYKRAHHFPESYPIIQNHTPSSLWMPMKGEPDFSAIHSLLSEFGNKPLILKDYVKSEKHHWEEACFIPNASDQAKVEQVVRRFLELRGDYLNEGLVFREYVELAPLSQHSKSGMPLTLEFRVFVGKGKPLEVVRYWKEGDYGGEEALLKPFKDLFSKVDNDFYTLDIARKKDASWTVMELGDAQVAGLPEAVDVNEFYQKLWENF